VRTIAYSIIQTSDGGYIVAGFTESFGAGGWDVLVIKLDSNGNIQWAKTYGGTELGCMLFQLSKLLMEGIYWLVIHFLLAQVVWML